MISIVALNGGKYKKYLPEFLSSIQPQLGNHELIVDPWFPDQHHADMINHVIAKARGEWILQVGTDDKLCPGALDALEKSIEPGFDVFYGNLKFFEGSDDVCLANQNITLEDFRENNQVYISSLFSKHAWKTVGGFWGDDNFAEDWDFWMRLMKAGFKFKYIDKIILEYRVHQDQAWNTMCEHFEEMKELINKRMDLI
jgi:glycosyltransferase involved in cell wall biosynthesis